MVTTYPRLSDWSIEQNDVSSRQSSFSKTYQHNIHLMNNYSMHEKRYNTKKEQKKRLRFTCLFFKCCSCTSSFVYGLILGILTGGIILAIFITLWLTSVNKISTKITEISRSNTTSNILTSFASTTTMTTTTSTTTMTTTTIITTTTETTSTTSETTTTTTSTTSGSTICSTTAITTTVTSSSLPAECSNYTLNTDGSRNAASGTNDTCDDNAFSSTPIWIRFSGAAGTLLANCPVEPFHCNTRATGWYSGVYPSTAGSTNTGIVCYNWPGNTCLYSHSISVTNCNGYYVYALTNTPRCILRYCTI